MVYELLGRRSLLFKGLHFGVAFFFLWDLNLVVPNSFLGSKYAQLSNYKILIPFP